MSTKCIDRQTRGFGVASLAVLTLPVVILVGGMGLSFQSSTARSFTSTVWMSYLGLELAEAAVAEASHFLKPSDVLAAVYPDVDGDADPASTLVQAMAADKVPGGVLQPDYRTIEDAGGNPESKLLVGFHFPDAAAHAVPGQGLARTLAAENPGVVDPQSIVVTARPLSFRREFRKGWGWVNWGVVQFTVTVKTRELKGISAHTLCVDRRFTLKVRPKKGEEILTVSSRNLRTTIIQEDR